MHRDVLRLFADAVLHRLHKLRHAFARQSGDEVHIHRVKAEFPRHRRRTEEVLHTVPAANAR